MKSFLAACSVLLLAPLALGCGGSLAEGPAPELRLRHIVLYQNGLGYFERTGVLPSDRLTLRFREREVNDVLKSVVFVEEGLGPNERPSTVTAHLPEQASQQDPEAPIALELVLSPATSRPVSIAYAVPTAAWKATYRLILPSETDKDAGKVLLQAWALIDNVGDEDWSSVKITLATGAPLSYASDIRSPTMIERPELRGIYGPSPQVNGPILAENSPGRDSDFDGIPDAVDACPREPGRAAADARQSGCPEMSRVVLAATEIRITQRVTFDKNADKVPAGATALIQEIANVLAAHPEIREIELSGHATPEETKPSDLGYRRAAAVRAALLRLGVTTEITLKSYGSDKPVAANDSDAHRALNRRVEFQVASRADDAKHRPLETVPVTEPVAPGRFELHTMSQGQAAASAAEAVAGSVRYAIDNPVTLAKKSSALITLINQAIPGEDVLLYRPDPSAPASSLRPFRAVRMEGKTDLALLAGSVSVFSGGTFVGEGVLAKLSPGETTSIPYAIDGTTEVRPKEDWAKKPLRIARLRRGEITVEDEERVTTKYEIAAGRLVPKKLYVRHARRGGYEIVLPKEEAEITADAVLAGVAIAAGGKATISVAETRVVTRTLDLVSMSWMDLGAYVEGTELAPATKKSLAHVVEMVRDLRKALDDSDELRRRHDELAERSAELRESIRSIEKTPQAEELRKTLLDRLAAATKELDEDAAKLARRSEDVATLRAELKESLRDLQIEPKAAPDKPANL